MSHQDRQPVAEALAAARPGETIEAALEESFSTSVTVAGGCLEASEDSRERGLGVRLFRDGRIGFAATSRLDGEGVAEVVARARDLAAYGRQEDENRPAAGADTGETAGPEKMDDLPAGVPPVALEEPALRLEEAARRRDHDLRTRAASVTTAGGRWLIAHTGGLWRTWSWRRAWASLEVVILRDGVRQTGWESDWSEKWEDLKLEKTGAAAAEQALRKFGSGRPPTARLPVVLAPTVTAGLFEALAGALSGKAVLRGRSLFAGRLGETIGAAVVTLTDNGARTDGFAAAPFDGEGTLSRPAVLIQNGVLTGFLHDTYTALKLQASPTGHAVRDGFSTQPHIGSRNLLLEPSGPSRAEIIASVSRGVLVDEVMGLHTVDPVSGDFSLGATGRELREGSPGAPLQGFTVAGNVRDILAAVQAVGDDVRFLPGGAGGSTVLLGSLSISGA
jgi:PmbA protein